METKGYAVKLPKYKEKIIHIPGGSRPVMVDVWVKATHPTRLSDKLKNAKIYARQEEAETVAFNIASWHPGLIGKVEVRAVKGTKKGLTSTACPQGLHKKPFLCVAVTDDTNSFGLFGMVLVAKDGESWKVYGTRLSEYAPIVKMGETVDVTAGPRGYRDWASHRMEAPERLEDCPAAKEVWKKTKKRVTKPRRAGSKG